MFKNISEMRLPINMTEEEMEDILEDIEIAVLLKERGILEDDSDR